jgi:hypothetical protein
MRLPLAFLFLHTALLATSAQAAPALYSASAKAQGAPFEMVVREIKREPNKSYLSVPGFHQRSAPAARWLMCAYTDLAVKRGFTHWFVAYPPENSEILIVGLTNSPDASAIEVLGNDYSPDQTLGNKPMPVAKMFQMCSKRH